MRIPKYRRHSSGKAFVVWKKKRYYLPGRYNTAESRGAYNRFVAEITRPNAAPRKTTAPGESLTVCEVAHQYLRAMKLALCDDSHVDPAYYHIRRMLHFVLRVHGMLPIVDFGPRALKEVRDEMMKAKKVRWVRRRNPDDTLLPGVELIETDMPLTRTYINEQVGRIRRFMSWAVAEEFMPAAKADALKHLPPLRKINGGNKSRRWNSDGETDTRPAVRETTDGPRESQRVRPANPKDIQKVLTAASPTLAGMIQTGELTGMRPTEICIMRPMDIDRSMEATLGIWEYRPTAYKTKEIDRADSIDQVVCLGPRVQAILLPFLDRPADAFMFSPRESVAWHHQQRWRGKGTSKRRDPKTYRKLHDRFDAGSYRQSLSRAIRRAGAQHWTPYQLRHTRGTEVRRDYQLEGAQAILRHRHAKVTGVYAERSLDLARKIAREIG